MTRSSTANPFAETRFLMSCSQLDQLPGDGLPEVAFVGRSNAGKSSALNALCGQRQLARVSKTPGRTQLINLFDLRGGRLVDLPGYGYAAVAREQRLGWGRLVGGFLETRTTLRGLVVIMDIRHPLTPTDRQLLEWARHRGLPCHCLLTKADKLGYGAVKQAVMDVRANLIEYGGTSAQGFSSVKGTGMDEFRAQVRTWLRGMPSDPETDSPA